MEDVSNDNGYTIETEDEPVYCPDRNEFLQIIENMQELSLSLADCVVVQSYANVARIIEQHLWEERGQTSIRY